MDLNQFNFILTPVMEEDSITLDLPEEAGAIPAANEDIDLSTIHLQVLARFNKQISLLQYVKKNSYHFKFRAKKDNVWDGLSDRSFVKLTRHWNIWFVLYFFKRFSLHLHLRMDAWEKTFVGNRCS